MRRFSFCSLVIALVLCSTITSAQVKISQVYGGGGNTFAPLSNDYIEIYNTGAPQDVMGWSVQYASSTGVFSAANTTALSAVSLILGTGQYLLVQEAAGVLISPQSVSLPAANATGTIAQALDSFKVALVSSTTFLPTGLPTYLGNPTLVDFVGAGTANWNDTAAAGSPFLAANNAPTASTTLAIYRNDCGAQDTASSKDNWAHGAPSPRNMATPLNAGLSLIGSVLPYIAKQGDTVSLRCTPRLCATNVLGAGTVVTADLTAFGLGLVAMSDGAVLGDDLAGDGVYMLDVVIPVLQVPASYQLPVSVVDGANSGGAYLGVAVVATASTPANDNCSTATPIIGPYSPMAATSAGTLSGANVESNPMLTGTLPVTGGFVSRRGVWYTVTGTGTTMTASLCKSLPVFDSVIMVFCGTCDGLTEVENDTDFCTVATGSLSRVSWCSTLGTTYYVWVAHNTSGAQTSTFTLSISDDGMACKGATNCPTCVLAAAVAQSEAEAGFGPATNDGCDTSPNGFTTIAEPGPIATVLNGTARNMGGNRDPDWYRFMATVTGQLTASVQGQAEGYQISLATLAAGGVCPATTIAASAISGRCGSTTLVSSVTAGTWYALRIICVGISGPLNLGRTNATTLFGGIIPGGGTHNYVAAVEILGVPLNDPCAGAQSITPGGTGSLGIAGDNSLATLDGPALGCGVPVDRDVWYSFRPGVVMPLWTISTCNGTAFDTVIEVYDACGGLLVACNDDDLGCGSGLQSRIDVALMAGMTFWIRVASKGNPVAGGAFNLVVIPGNDVCGRNMASYTIPGAGGSVSANLALGSGEGVVNSSCNSGGAVVGTNKDLYYYFTPTDPCATGWTFSTCCTNDYNIDTAVSVHTACPTALVNNQFLANCFDDGCVAPVAGGNFSFGTATGLNALIVGTPYIVRLSIWAAGGTGGPVTLSVTPVGGGADLCANALTLALGGAAVTGTTACATNDGTSVCDPTGRDVWYKVTTTNFGNLHVDTCGSLIDTVVSLYSGSCGSLVPLGCNDDATGCPCLGPSSSLDVPGLAPGMYIIRVSDKNIGLGGVFTVKASVTVVPTNDACATPSTLALGTAVAGNTACATNDGSASCDLVGRDLWYTATTTVVGTLHVDTCGSAIDTVVTVYVAGGACGALVELACNDDATGCPCAAPSSSVDILAAPIGTYRIRVSDKLLGLGGAFSVKALTVLVPNDNCCNAITVTCGSTTAGTINGATSDTGELPASCVGPATGFGGTNFTFTNSVWYKVTPAVAGTVTVDTLTSVPTWDSKIWVFSGVCGALTCLTANDDVVSAFMSRVAWVANAGQTYYIMVGPFGATGTSLFNLRVTCNPTPANDDCGTPTVLTPVPSGLVAGTTVGATSPIYVTTSSHPTCNVLGSIFDVWYSYTACANGNLTLGTCGADDTTMSVHTACPTLGTPPTTGGVNNQLTPTATSCNNNGPAGCTPGSQLTVAVTSGTTYLIRVVSNPGSNLGAAHSLTWSATGVPVWFQDADSDTYGNPSVSQVACSQPGGYVANNGDCDDGNALINPGATEVCDLVDNDCDGMIDEGVTTTFYQDSDSDTYGNPAVSVQACSLPLGYSANNLDCDDTNAAINPGATEICDTIDNDCDGMVDEGVTTTFYQDLDNDTYGNLAVPIQACSLPSGYSANSTDCDDTNAAVNPGATEICNAIDDDCDTIVDEGCPSNDFCAAATPIGNGSVTGNNTGAASEIGDLTCGPVSNDVWYSYANTLTCTKTVTVSMCPNEGGFGTFDAVLHAFSGTCGALTLLACNNNTCGTNPKITFTIPASSSALIAVSAVAPGPGGSFKLLVSHKTAAFFLVGPGCSPGPAPGPTLTIDAPPVLSSTRTLSITGAAPLSGGILFMSSPAVIFAPLPFGCSLFVDQGTLLILVFPATDGSGNWSLTANVPDNPRLECLPLTLQAIILPVGGVPFYQVTDGLGLILGY